MDRQHKEGVLAVAGARFEPYMDAIDPGARILALLTVEKAVTELAGPGLLFSKTLSPDDIREPYWSNVPVIRLGATRSSLPSRLKSATTIG